MNKQEAQRKFDQNSHIDNSLYDAVNTNATRRAVPSLNNNNLLPKDRSDKNATSSGFLVLLLSCLGVGAAVFCYFVIVPLSEKFLPSTVYDSLGYLAFAILFACFFGWVIKTVIALIIRRILRSDHT